MSLQFGLKGLQSVIVLASVFVVMIAIPAAAQSDRPNSLEPGAWALQFRVNDNFSLSAFEGGNFSIKRQWSAKSALRAGVGFDLGSTDWSYGSEQESNTYGVELTTVYQRYVRPEQRGAFYWGFGPLVDFNYATNKSISDGTLNAKFKTTNWSVGVIGLAGAEWFATRTISLHAEYRGSASYRVSKEERTLYPTGSDPVEETKKNTNWFFGGAGSVLFGLSLYF